MLKPHHKSYYNYFNKNRLDDLHKYSRRNMNLYTAIRKLADKKCAMGEFHFLFNIIKSSIGIGLNSPHEDPLVAYNRVVERTHPGIFDNFHADLRRPIEEDVHPWRFRKKVTVLRLSEAFLCNCKEVEGEE